MNNSSGAYEVHLVGHSIQDIIPTALEKNTKLATDLALKSTRTVYELKKPSSDVFKAGMETWRAKIKASGNVVVVDERMRAKKDDLPLENVKDLHQTDKERECKVESLSENLSPEPNAGYSF